MGSVRFTATLVPRGPAAAVVLDGEHVAAVGEGAQRFPVLATVNGYTWHTTVSRMRGEFLVGLNRAVRQQAGVYAGDTVEVKLELDTAPREVEVPEALANALAEDSKARAAFDRLAFTYRKEYVRWINEAKRDETRQRRVTQALEALRQGRDSDLRPRGDRITREAEAGATISQGAWPSPTPFPYCPEDCPAPSRLRLKRQAVEPKPRSAPPVFKTGRAWQPHAWMVRFHRRSMHGTRCRSRAVS